MTGYGPQRALMRGHRCSVIAPSTTPCCPAVHLKTDRRDAMEVARFIRARHSWERRSCLGHERILAALSLSAFNITETELRLIASAATIGLNSQPDSGNSTPAASGTPAAL